MTFFEIKGKDALIRIEILEVLGFPNTTHFDGGFDCNLHIIITVEGYSVNSNFYATTKNLITFREQLRESQNKLKGTVEFYHRESNLKLKLDYCKTGNISVSGNFQKHLSTDNILEFDFGSDQSYMSNTLYQLEKLDKFKQ